MKKGIRIKAFTETKSEEYFKSVKDAGFDGVELTLNKHGPVNLNSTPKEIKHIKKSADLLGLKLYNLACGLYWNYNYTSFDPVIREKAKEITKKQLEIASWLGCESISVIPGAVGIPFEPDNEIVDYDVAYARCFDTLAQLAPLAEKLHIQLCIENVWNKFLLSPLEMRDLIDKIDSAYVGAYFDVGNVLYCGYPEQWIKILGNRIKKVRFKDYRRDVGTLSGFVDLLAGDVDYKAVMAGFKKIGYDGWVTAEMLPPYKQSPKTFLHNTANAIEKIITEGKDL